MGNRKYGGILHSPVLSYTVPLNFPTYFPHCASRHKSAIGATAFYPHGASISYDVVGGDKRLGRSRILSALSLCGCVFIISPFFCSTGHLLRGGLLFHNNIALFSRILTSYCHREKNIGMGLRTLNVHEICCI